VTFSKVIDIGKVIVISPPSGRETGINSAIIEIIIKNSTGNHIFDKSGIVGSR